MNQRPNTRSQTSARSRGRANTPTPRSRRGRGTPPPTPGARGTPTSQAPGGSASTSGGPQTSSGSQPTGQSGMATITLADVRQVVSEAVTGGMASLSGFNIEKYDGRISSDASQWVDNYIDATNLKGWNDDQRFRNFNQFLYLNASKWYKLYVKNAQSPPTDWTALKQLFLDYHVPTDRTNALREAMVKRKQTNEDVIQYITDKRLLCMEYNNSMPFDEMKSFIIEGMIPEIRATITHKENPNLDSLQKNAKNIEKGLKDSGKLSFIDKERIERRLHDESLKALNDKFDKLMEKLDSKYDERRRERSVSRGREYSIERPRREYRDNDYDRYGRRLQDRRSNGLRRNYTFYTREFPRDNDLDYMRGRRPRYATNFEERPLRNDRLNSRERYEERRNRPQSPAYASESGDSRPNSPYRHRRLSDPLSPIDPYRPGRLSASPAPNDRRTDGQNERPKHVEFDIARKLSRSRDLNGDIRCFRCDKVGHYARDCRTRDIEPRTQRRAFTAFCNSEATDGQNHNLIYQTVDIKGHKIQSIIDSGSEVCLIDDATRIELKLGLLPCSRGPVKAANGEALNITGDVVLTVRLILHNKPKDIVVKAYSVKNFDFNLLLGNDFAQKAGFLIDCSNKRLLWSDMVDIQPESGTVCCVTTDNRIHLTKAITIGPRGTAFAKICPNNKRVNQQMVCKVITDEKLFETSGLFVKSASIQFNKGRAVIPIVNCLTMPVTLTCGNVIARYSLDSKHLEDDLISQTGSDSEDSLLCEHDYNSDSDSDDSVRNILDINDGELMFSQRKAFMDYWHLDPLSDDWFEGLCRYCNRFHNNNDNHCIFAYKWHRSPYWRQRKDSEFNHFDNLRRLYQNNIKNNSHMKSCLKTSKSCNSAVVTSTIPGIIINETLTIDQRAQLTDLLSEYRDIFAFDKNVIGNCGIDKFRLKLLDPNQTPIKQNPYIYSASQKIIINSQIQTRIDLGIAEPCISSYGAPVVLIDKKSYDLEGRREKRLCIDYRKINKVTADDVYPIPDLKSCLSQFAKAKYFSMIDQNNGYMQFEVDERDRHLTAFRTQEGLYQFKRLPFGLKQAPSFFMRCMHKVYGPLVNEIIIVYFDDGIIYSETFDEHLSHLKSVFDCLRSANLTLEPTKCSFGQRELTFLGYKISDQGIDADPEKVKSIVKFPRPLNLTGVRSFVGLAGFYRRKVPNFAKIAEPLTRLTKKVIDDIAGNKSEFDKRIRKSDEGRVFLWEAEQELAFNALKRAITTSPILVHFDNNLPLEVHTDGSLQGVGGALYHVIDGKLSPFCFQSWLLHDSEKNFSIPDIECLAIIKITIKCQEYLIGKPFTIVTDCLALKWMDEKKSLNPRLLRWSLHLQNFQYEVRHRSGKLNRVADALSRFPVSEPELMIDNCEKFCALLNPSAYHIPICSISDLASKQKTDHHFSKIYETIERIPKHKLHKKYTIFDGILYKSSRIHIEPALVVCLPLVKVLEVLYSYHDEMISGSHLGIDKTYEKIALRFYWPKMRRDIIDYVNSCSDCLAKKKPLQPDAGLLIPITRDAPFEMVGIDFLGRFKTSTKGNTYIICATDYFSKWAVAKAIPAANKEYAADFVIDDIICKYGSIGTLLSDRGQQFRAKFSQAIYERLNVRHFMTSSYHPQTNGLVEKFNQTIAKMISSYVNKSQDLWDSGLQWLIFSYNTSINATTGYSPYKLLFGHEASLPPDRGNGIPIMGFENENQYIETLKTRIHNLHKNVRINNQKASDKNKRHYDSKHRELGFTVGQKVLVHYPTRFVGKSTKLLSPFHGPFEVTKVFPNGVNIEIKAKLNSKKNIVDTVHISRVKLFKDREQLISRLEALAYTPPKSLTNSSDEDSYKEQQMYEMVRTDSDEETVVYDYNVDFKSDKLSRKQLRPISNEKLIRTVEPRRSTRIKRPPKVFDLLNTLFMCLITISITECSLERSSPVVWRKADNPVVTGMNRVIITVKYESPCQVLDNDFFKNTGAKEPLDKWCQSSYERDFIKPVHTFCDSPIDIAKESLRVGQDLKRDIGHIRNDTLVYSRPERAVIFAIGVVAVISIAVSAIIGLTASSYVQSSNARKDIEKLKRENELMAIKLKTLEQNDLTTKAIFNLIQTQLSDFNDELSSVKESILALGGSVHHTITYVANIASRLVVYSDRLKDISRKWKNNIVDEKIMDLFNFTLPCGSECPLSQAEPRGCSIDDHREIITLIFDVKTIKKNVALLKADPFVLYDRPKNGTVLCPINFIGPEMAIYDKQTDCVVALPKNSHSSNNLAVMPTFEKCDSPLPDNVTAKYWRADPCEERHNLVVRDLAQIKPFGTINYIYCKSFYIYVYDRFTLCPEFPFSLPSTASFTIGTLQYQGQTTQYFSKVSFDSGLSQRVNFHLMPQMHSFNFDSIARKMSHQIESISVDQSHTPYVLNENISFVDILLLSLLFTIIAIALLYNRKYRKRMLSGMPNNDIELKETEGEAKRNSGSSCPPPPFAATKATLLIAFVCLTSIEPIVSDSEFLNLNLKYENPCISPELENLDSIAIRWCEIQFNDSFVFQIMKFCVTPYPVVNFERTLFITQNRSKRNTEGLMPLLSKTGKYQGYDMASLAARFVLIRNTISKIGIKWAKGELDEFFINSPHIRLQIPNNRTIREYEPHACNLDLNCRLIRLELKYRSGFNAITKTTGFNRTEDTLTCILLLLVLSIAYMTRRIRSLIKQRDWAFKYMMTGCRSRSFDEPLIAPPPYPSIDTSSV